MNYWYYINLDERGVFDADVRDEHGTTVFEFGSDEDGEVDIFIDGYMDNKNDLDGLQDYLIELGVLTKHDRLQKA